MTSQTELEAAAVELYADLLPAAEGPVLRRQFEGAELVERRFTGVGFFTALDPSAVGPLLPLATKRLGAVRLDPEGPGLCVAASGPGFHRSGAGFSLWFEGGRLTTIEGFTYEGTWPQDLAGACVEYASIAVIEGAVP